MLLSACYSHRDVK